MELGAASLLNPPEQPDQRLGPHEFLTLGGVEHLRRGSPIGHVSLTRLWSGPRRRRSRDPMGGCRRRRGPTCGSLGCVSRRSVTQYSGVSGVVARSSAERKEEAERQRRSNAISVASDGGRWLASCQCGWTSLPTPHRVDAAKEGRRHTANPCGGARTVPLLESGSLVQTPEPEPITTDRIDSFVIRQFERKWCWQCKRCGTAGGWTDGSEAKQRAEFDTFNHRCDD